MTTTTDGKKLMDAVNTSELSVAEFHRAMGISKGTLYNLYKESDLDADVKAKAAQILKVPVVELFGQKSNAENAQAPLQEQGAEGAGAKSPATMLEILVQAEGFRAKADYERSLAHKSIAETNKLLAEAVVKETLSVIEHAPANSAGALPSTADGLRDLILDVLLDLGYEGPKERKVKAHRASLQKDQ